MKLDWYVDADFDGIYHVENNQDPTCVKYRTGYGILLDGCTIICTSKLQKEIYLSNLEAEYIALSKSMRNFLPQRELLQEIG